MIPLYEAAVDSCDWQKQLSEIIRTPEALLQALNLSKSLLNGTALGHQDFSVRVPRPYLRRIEPGNPHDPLLRQVLPLDAECLDIPGYVLDPLAELSANKTPGIVHKYAGRVLLISATSCAIHCRYCFRRHFPYSDNRISRRQWDQSLEYIRQDTSLKEVILSGGDPWMQTDAQLFDLLSMIESIEHIKRIRVHTRLPVVIPSRVTDALAARLGSSRLKVVVVIHANHANELDADVGDAVGKLTRAGVWVLNQSVLLRGVNDQAQALIDLSERLLDIDVKPYYLHLLDPVRGAAHFNVPKAVAIQLHLTLQRCLPGFLVPKLVRETPNELGKTWVAVDGD